MARKRQKRHQRQASKMPKTAIINGGVFIALLAIGASVWAMWPSLSGQTGLPSGWTITPEQEEFIGSASDYLTKLEKEGLTTVKELRVENGEPFIFIKKPKNTNEITGEDVLFVKDLALFTMKVLETHGGFYIEDINLPFHRPKGQNLILIRRNNLPDIISESRLGEFSLAVDKEYIFSVINFAGPTKVGRRDYASAWSVIQALCLGYTTIDPGTDAKCNIMSANAAAGWAGIEKQEAANIVNGFGSTSLGYLGSPDYKYRFIEFIYDEFAQRRLNQ